MERIGEYLIGRLVGEGGMGKVYEAEERLSKRRVALKVLRPELARSEEGRRLFLNEMTILAHLDHPNLVRCLACQEVDGELVMVLEFLDGQTLRQLLSARGRLPWTEAVAITAQIAAGLQAAHGQTPPVVHRDLKPENVMISEQSRVKVMDFGIAKVLEALQGSTTHSVGTLQYMSPEQIDAGTVGPPSDLYALGLILYEMLAGQPPFVSASPRELLNAQCTEPAPPLPDEVRRGLPRGVERLLFALLGKRPEERPASAEEVLTALEPFGAADEEIRLGAAAEGASASESSASESSASKSSASAPTSDQEQRTPVGSASSVPPVGASNPPGASARRPVAHPPLAADTIALVEQASAPRQIPGPWAVLIIVVLSVLAGVVTYLARTGSASGADLPAEALTARGDF